MTAIGTNRVCISVLILIVAAVVAEHLSADETDIDKARPSIDLYEQIGILKDSLTAWKRMDASFPSSDTLTGMSDIDDIGSSYETTTEYTTHDQIRLTVNVPQHEYFEGYNLSIAFKRASNNDLFIAEPYGHKITPKLKKTITDLCDSLQSGVCALVQSHIEGSVALCRLLPFPSTIWLSRASHEIPASLILHGRDVDTIVYAKSAHLFCGLHRIFSNLFSYVDVLPIRTDSSGVYVRYLVLVTVEGAKGHHLLEVKEHIEIGDSIRLHGITADLFPLIRTDNVSDLMKVMDYERHDLQVDVHRTPHER